MARNSNRPVRASTTIFFEPYRGVAYGVWEEGAVIVQWCLKGMHLDSDALARALIDNRGGLTCNWWRDVGAIGVTAVRDKLTRANLDRHVNHFYAPDPVTGRPFNEVTPFISLTAGTVERDKVMRTNTTHTAREAALAFGSGFGLHPKAYLYRCWVLVAPRQAVCIEGVAEEVRDLATYRSYSDFQLEGEIVAKVGVPENQVECCERWDMDPTQGWVLAWTHPNPTFTQPTELSNVRELIGP